MFREPAELELRRPFAKPTKGTVGRNVEFGQTLGNVRPLIVYISHPSLLWELRACMQRSGAWPSSAVPTNSRSICRALELRTMPAARWTCASPFGK